MAVKRGKKRGLMLMSPRPGNYKFICDSDFGNKVKEGTLIDFLCPACGVDLTSAASKKLAEINLHQPDQPIKRVQFSKVHGEQATFVLADETIVPYGEDAYLYDEVNFFGV
jgi:hypothetical protein